MPKVPILNDGSASFEQCKRCGSPYFESAFRILVVKSKLEIGKTEKTPVPTLLCKHCNTEIGTGGEGGNGG